MLTAARFQHDTSRQGGAGFTSVGPPRRLLRPGDFLNGSSPHNDSLIHAS